MSRLIVKNLPRGIKEDRLFGLFNAKGQITDCSLKYTRGGVFRKFAFIGYKTAEEADGAIKFFNNSFIDTSKIQVELAKDFSDETKPRSWSKYSKDSSAFQNKQQKNEIDKATPDPQQSKPDIKQKVKDEMVADILGDLKDDTKFQEFMEAHKNITLKPVWSNDAGEGKQAPVEATQKGEGQTREDSNTSEEEEEEQEEVEQKTDKVPKEKNKVATKKGVSDLEYLKTKMADTVMLSEESSASSDSETEEVSAKKKKSKRSKAEKPTPGKSSTGEKQEAEMEETAETKQDKSKKSKYVLKMRGFQAKVNEKAIKEFFAPIKVQNINISKNARKMPIGVALVSFASEDDREQAMRRNKNFIGANRIFLKKSAVKSSECQKEEAPRPWELKQQEKNEDDETIAESGRLFLRNLTYSCTEEDLETMFVKYGPLTEVNMPIDSLTKKVKGFAFITYMFPEHAVKAFTDLDGTVFQGRMLHILPAKSKKEDIDLHENASFKKQREAKKKAQAASSHTWNSLFLGASAVADVMAEGYGVSKSHILDAEGSASLGVRMALGETQIVSVTRDFLVENGVSLDSFSQPSAARSKTVILVKNLPAGTKITELNDIFSKHGTLGRLVLPPSGITAIVEYLEPAEARAGFTRLAYTKFHHLPLYLEWAPVDVFKAETKVADSKEAGQSENPDIDPDKEESSESEDEIEPNSTLFVKNLNFDTTDEELRQKFEKCGEIRSATVSKKKDMKNAGQLLSMGYGFVEFRHQESAKKALKELQHTELDGHQLELKISNRATLKPEVKTRKKQKETKQKSSKILVRNIPFEANKRELTELFKVFGELKSVRLPEKLTGTGTHRGFGFIDYLTKQDAKRAFNALCHSTHLYGRRLVLEWAETAENVETLRKKTAERYSEEVPRKKLKKSSIMEKLEASQDND